MDRAGLKGRELGEVTFPIERGKLRELARSLHDDDPVWHDVDAARAAGFDGIPVPPTATVIAVHWQEGGIIGHALALGMDRARLLHGEAGWRFEQPLRAGDELTASTRVADVAVREGRRGGAMTLLTLETTFVNQRGEHVARLRDVWIETAAP